MNTFFSPVGSTRRFFVYNGSAMLQDIKPYKYDNAYQQDAFPAPGDEAVCFFKDYILIRRDEEGQIAFPRFEEIQACADMQKLPTCRYLFAITNEEKDERHRLFLLPCTEEMFKLLQEQDKWQDKKACEAISQDEVQYCMPKWMAFAGATACHLADWYDQNRLCGRCGAVMKHSGTERMVYCPKCGQQVYPRINPVVIVGVIDGEKLLLTKYARGMYHEHALVAGFVEAGETLDQAVEREVFEETGIHVKNIRYFDSQPWPLSGSLIAGMFCELDGSAQTTLRDGELSVAEWVNRDDIEIDEEDHISITSEMMQAFKRGEIDINWL